MTDLGHHFTRGLCSEIVAILELHRLDAANENTPTTHRTLR